MTINVNRVTALRAFRGKCLAAHLMELWERSNQYGNETDVAKWRSRWARVNRWNDHAADIRWMPVH